MVGRLRRPLVVLFVGSLVAIAVRALAREPAPSPCGAGELLLVDTKEHALTLCAQGKAEATFGVRLGKHGTGKSAEGDGKTPLGRYDLGDPRASAKYGTFVPIGYPTRAQRANGATGGAVGVHGPDRRLAFAGRLLNHLDTTDGCVGVATDAEMATIAAFVRAHPRAGIELR